jgi:hypothetical protein
VIRIKTKKEVPYLYGKVTEKIEELMSKSPKMELDVEILKRNLPNKMRLTRGDVNEVLMELDKTDKFKLEGKKLYRRGYEK